MADTARRELPTRREYVRGSAAVVGGGLLAGCTSSGPGSSSNGTGANSSADNSDPIEVTMAPMGSVGFDTVPENVFTVFPQYADMAVALGYGDRVSSMFSTEMAGTTMNHYYARLPGVSFEWGDLRNPWKNGLPKERLYELNSDIHLVDPAYVTTLENWSRSDIEEIRTNLGPWFGNFYSGTHEQPPSSYGGSYQYYTLWELFGKIAAVFRERKRYEALAGIHTDLIETIRENLPPKDERPTAVRVTKRDEEFYTYHLNKPGYWLADTRPLGAIDAFTEEDWSNLWGTVGYETMLEANPDVILHLWGFGPNYDMKNIRMDLQSHPIGSQLSAVQNDRVYPAGMRYQGPIMNLFQLEMGAKQLYPDVFGQWPEYVDDEPYPEIPEGEQLFDRGQLSRIINGEF